jgi:quinolinate synthase
MVSHYYVHPDLQDLAEETGGIVSDSPGDGALWPRPCGADAGGLGREVHGRDGQDPQPRKAVLMPDLDANCSLDLGCPVDEFSAFCDAAPRPHRGGLCQHQRRGEGARRLAGHVQLRAGHRAALKDQGHKILWAPDRHLGGYIQRETGADMVFWNGACIVHDEFKAFELEALKKEHPGAKVLVHPESPADVVALADAVGSTSAILKARARWTPRSSSWPPTTA